MEFKLSMTLKELKHRTSKQTYKGIKLLSGDDREVKKLTNDDLLVLCHLTRAAKYIDEIHFKLENHKNQEFLRFLDSEIERGDKRAPLAKRMFLSQKSMFSPDNLGNSTVLAKGEVQPLGLGYFPADLAPSEFHKILNQMLDAGKTMEVKNILSQRTIVFRDGENLKAIDFVDAFDELKKAANELRLAKKWSTDRSFNKFLELQIAALKKADPKLDAKADIAWAKLKGCKFEFTITRECYDESLTKTIYENEELLKRLDSVGVTVYAKDSLGARVGIINKPGTRLLNKLKSLNTIAKELMPYKEEYTFAEDNDPNQVAVDVDIVTLTGEEGAYQAGIVLAQNLPNDDKLALKLGGGRRNVYHRQIRKKHNKKLYKALIADEQFCLFNPEADHWGTICHENTHSLGPSSHNVLGKYSAILEEYKADMGIYAFLNEFVEAGYFSKTQAEQIIVTNLAKSFLKGKPTMDQPHRVRSVMIVNRMLNARAIEIKDNKIWFDFNKVIATARTMLAEVVRLQLDKNVKNAGEYVDKWFIWNDNLEKIAEIIKQHSKALNGYLITPLAGEFLDPDYEKKLGKG